MSIKNRVRFLWSSLGEKTGGVIHFVLALGAARSLVEMGLHPAAAAAASWLFFLAREQVTVAVRVKMYERLRPDWEEPEARPWKFWTWSAHAHYEHLAALVGALLSLALA